MFGYVVEDDEFESGLRQLIDIKSQPQLKAILLTDRLHPRDIAVYASGNPCNTPKTWQAIRSDIVRLCDLTKQDDTAADSREDRESNSFDFISLDRIAQATRGEFKGRKSELAALDAAAANPDVRILVLHAFAGVGKTSLIKEWKDTQATAHWNAFQQGFGFSFYGQAQRETANSDLFFEKSLLHFGEAPPKLGRDWTDRVNRLVSRIRKQKSLLILDGLEVLQHPIDAHRDCAIQDQLVLEFLMRLAGSSFSGLCIVTTRYWPGNLSSHYVKELPLQELSAIDARELLVSRGLQEFQEPDGRDALGELAKDLGHNALALRIAAQFLVTRHQGDPRKRNLIQRIPGDAGEGSHARRVLAKYRDALENENHLVDLAVVRLLTLFDHPISVTEFFALCDKLVPVILGRALRIADIEIAVEALRQFGLVSGGRAHVDLHPLVRQFFREDFERSANGDWKACHRQLFNMLLATAPLRLSSLELDKTRQTGMNERQKSAAESLARVIRHACLSGCYWDGLAVLACRIDESTTLPEGLVRFGLRMWSALSRFRTLEWAAIRALTLAGRFRIGLFSRFYRNDTDVDAPIGFYSGSQVKAWTLRFRLATMFYPVFDIRERPVFHDRFVSSYVDLTTAFCCSALGYNRDVGLPARRAYEHLQSLAFGPLAHVAVYGLTVCKLVTGQIGEAELTADEATRYAVTKQQKAEAIALCAAVKSYQGLREVADMHFREAILINGRLSTRSSWFYWEHVVRFHGPEAAETVLDEARQESRSRDDIDYHVLLRLTLVDCEIQRAWSAPAANRIAALKRRVREEYEEFGESRLDGAFRARHQFQSAQISVLNALYGTADMACVAEANDAVNAAERLADAADYLPLLLDSRLLRVRLLHRFQSDQDARTVLNDVEAEVVRSGFRALQPEIDQIRDDISS